MANEKIVVEVIFKQSAFWLNKYDNRIINQIVEEIEKLRASDKELLQPNKLITCNNLLTQYVESYKVISMELESPIVMSLQEQQFLWINQEDFNQCLNEKIKKYNKYKSYERNSDIQEYWLAIAIHEKEPYMFWDCPYQLPEELCYSRIFLIQYDGIKELTSKI